jgi:hypothetical protein
MIALSFADEMFKKSADEGAKGAATCLRRNLLVAGPQRRTAFVVWSTL